MNDLKKLFKVIWKRFSLWIILFTILTVLLNGLAVRNQIKSNEKSLRESVETMATKVNIAKPKAGDKLDKAYMDEAEEISKRYASKYKIKYERYSEDAWFSDIEGFDETNNSDLYYDLLSPIQDYEYASELTSKEGMANYFASNLLAPIIIFVAITALLITSLEQCLAYSEFTSMFPWKKQDEVWMKSLIVFLLGLGILLVNFLISFISLKSSAFSDVADMSLVGDKILKMILVILGASTIAVSTGMIAGNFIGHIGLGIIALAGIDLIFLNLNVIISLFSDSYASILDDKYGSFKDNLPNFVKPFISLSNVDVKYDYLISFMVIAILIAILAYMVNQKVSSEKSGYMIISKPIEKFTKICAIFSFAGIFYLVFSDVISNYSMIILNLIIYGLGLLIGTKLFDILFKIRLKF
ncbi:hypothetical protein [uncultured Anaerococcus sp.]|uniref:hypothetical protein n=1 Tax=uncultured Anaerococcus sp. TaxID=293428 RepID=UPI0026394C54|nr:hypothetical protein [uncultured Anaerococcus sp.]